MRLFDLNREDAEPIIFGNREDGLSCDGIIKSIVWDEGQGGNVCVSAAEDGIVRWWDTRNPRAQTSELNLEEPVSSMELAHGGGTLSVTAGNKIHFLDILR